MSRLNHYDCSVEHPRKGRPWPGNHNSGCPVAQGHDFGKKLANCRACAREYQSKTWVKPSDPSPRAPVLRRRNADHPHYNCSLPPEDHPVIRGAGHDHRRGCEVAEGHTPGTSAGGRGGCAGCHKFSQRLYGRSQALRQKFGMTLDDYQVMFDAQGGRCAICGQEQGFNLAVDHDHKTGEKRGLLCKACNVSLGGFRDDPEIVLKAAEYLVKWSARDASL